MDLAYTDKTRSSRAQLNAAVVIVALAPLMVLVLHLLRYYPFIADDALISLRYARRFAEGDGLTWTDGDRVEGYSNLTWVLVSAMFHVVRVDLILANRIMGVASFFFLFCAMLKRPISASLSPIYATVSAIALAATGTAATWAIGGLEQPFVALSLGLALLYCRDVAGGSQRYRTAQASLAVLCLTRPDGGLLASAVLFGTLIAGVPLRVIARLGWPAAAAIGLQLVFRLAYYQDWIPNTARAKVAFSQARLHSGWEYFSSGAKSYWPIFGLAVLMLVVSRKVRRSWAIYFVPAIAWCAYMIFIGGDIFPARRHWLAVLVVLAVLIADPALAPKLRARSSKFLFACAVATLLACQVSLTLRDPENQRSIDERWEWDGQVVGKLLKSAFSAQSPLLAVDAAGTLPYFSELPAIDMLGLNDRYLGKHPPSDLGAGYIGHELGNGEYVAGREPDLIVFCLPGGGARGCFRSGVELVARPDFRTHYALVTFEGRTPYVFRSQIFVRRDGKVGWKELGAGGIEYPGHLLGQFGRVAALDSQDRIGAELPAATSTVVVLPKPCPDCRLDIAASGDVRGTMLGPRKVRLTALTQAHVRSLRLLPTP